MGLFRSADRDGQKAEINKAVDDMHDADEKYGFGSFESEAAEMRAIEKARAWESKHGRYGAPDGY
jgi:hypothetical protein